VAVEQSISEDTFTFKIFSSIADDFSERLHLPRHCLHKRRNNVA
jgi:hypothetical protein